MIVETKVIDLNKETKTSGYVSKNKFTSLYDGYTFNTEINKDYVFFDYNNRLTIDNISYFSEQLDEQIMHPLLLIRKDEAENKGIEKIGIFLVNGEVEKDSIPSLTYGVGEGRIMQIHRNRGEEQ